MASRHWLRARAWVVLVVIGALTIVSGVFLLVVGEDPEEFERQTSASWQQLTSTQPDVAEFIDDLARGIGLGWLAFGVLATAIAWGPFRRGERWAWRALWTLPALFAAFIGANAAAGSNVWQFYVAHLALSVMALVATLPARVDSRRMATTGRLDM